MPAVFSSFLSDDVYIFFLAVTTKKVRLQNTNRALLRSLYCNRTDFIQSLQGFASPPHNGFANYSVYPVPGLSRNATQFSVQTESNILHRTTDYLTKFEFSDMIIQRISIFVKYFQKAFLYTFDLFFLFSAVNRSFACCKSFMAGGRKPMHPQSLVLQKRKAVSFHTHRFSASPPFVSGILSGAD